MDERVVIVGWVWFLFFSLVARAGGERRCGSLLGGRIDGERREVGWVDEIGGKVERKGQGEMVDWWCGEFAGNSWSDIIVCYCTPSTSMEWERIKLVVEPAAWRLSELSAAVSTFLEGKC
jgi:hypothetical protein